MTGSVRLDLGALDHDAADVAGRARATAGPGPMHLLVVAQGSRQALGHEAAPATPLVGRRRRDLEASSVLAGG